MSPRAELSSAATRLHELVERVTSIANGLNESERDDLGTELFEVERILRNAERRLVRILDR